MSIGKHNICSMRRSSSSFSWLDTQTPSFSSVPRSFAVDNLPSSTSTITNIDLKHDPLIRLPYRNQYMYLQELITVFVPVVCQKSLFQSISLKIVISVPVVSLS
ncbi:hypothetical protein Hanom_Chr04g00294351 [Helianthus anomalus]